MGTWLINYNMRCIETFEVYGILDLEIKINYNMRCIETADRSGNQ